jgi:hypothetical protein
VKGYPATEASTLDVWPGLRTRPLEVWHRLASSAWFAYATLVLLQLKVIDGMWRYRDISTGDTASYYLNAWQWHRYRQTNIVMSPLYTMFYGTMMRVSDHAYVVTIIHRVVLVLVVAVLVLALMRRLLPPGLAWLVTAWWALTPVNFDTLYEVHLFAAIPILVACLVASCGPGVWSRGATLGILMAGGLLVRNEVLVAAGLWALACAIREVHEARTAGRPSYRRYVAAYGIPIVLAVLLVVPVHAGTVSWVPDLSARLPLKHTLNVCQIYAYGYRQRHVDWTGSPWTECQDLMQRDFGVPLPSMTEALARNPRAMLEHFLWNVRLIPDGLQVLLFNATAGHGQPDYIRRATGSRFALVMTVFTLVVLVVGGWRLWRDRWWERWIAARVWGWLALSFVVVVTLVVMVTQRPRPSYLLALFFFMAALCGMCVLAIVDRLGGAGWLGLLAPVVAVGLIVLAPRHFTPAYRNLDGSASRPVLLRYERLVPFQRLLAEPGARLLANGWPFELCAYIAPRACTGVEYRDFMARKPGAVSVADWLAHDDITLFYADETVLADPAARSFVDDAAGHGWQTVARVETADARWRLFQRRTGPRP